MKAFAPIVSPPSAVFRLPSIIARQNAHAVNVARVVSVIFRRPAREVDTVQNNTAIHAAAIRAVGMPKSDRNKA